MALPNATRTRGHYELAIFTAIAHLNCKACGKSKPIVLGDGRSMRELNRDFETFMSSHEPLCPKVKRKEEN